MTGNYNSTAVCTVLVRYGRTVQLCHSTYGCVTIRPYCTVNLYNMSHHVFFCCLTFFVFVSHHVACVAPCVAHDVTAVRFSLQTKVQAEPILNQRL